MLISAWRKVKESEPNADQSFVEFSSKQFPPWRPLKCVLQHSPAAIAAWGLGGQVGMGAGLAVGTIVGGAPM